MKCSEAHKLISPYIDSELSEKERNAVENHLNVCPGCRTELEETRQLQGLFEGVAEYKAPYGFQTRVMANLAAGRPAKRYSIPILTRFAEAVAVIGVIAIGMISGASLVKGPSPEKAQIMVASLSLDLFEPTPPGSLGGVYLAMTEVRDEK
ncbi:MAG: zf-HC2 domain-containing protein [Nitrospirae bacterium]|nr:zf-HC2 domain-containing protein [Nitrospirota bacterium]